MDPLSGAAGLYFSYTSNITTTVQQHLAMDHNQALWKNSIEELWWNGAISSPLRGTSSSLNRLFMRWWPLVLKVVPCIARLACTFAIHSGDT